MNWHQASGIGRQEKVLTPDARHLIPEIGGRGWIRTTVGVSQRVYSASPLAARAPVQEAALYRLWGYGLKRATAATAFHHARAQTAGARAPPARPHSGTGAAGGGRAGAAGGRARGGFPRGPRR